MNSGTTVGQAADAAAKELKRKAPDFGNVQLRSVRHKDRNGRFKEEIMERIAKMQPSYELQLEVEDADILQRRQEEEEFRCFSLEPLVISFGSNVSARLVTGVARSGHDKDASGVQKYLEGPGNYVKVARFMQSASLKGEPADFAVALDKNYNARNDNAHNTTDEYLEMTAARLKRMGAVRLLAKQYPAQCALIEHFASVKAHLFV